MHLATRFEVRREQQPDGEWRPANCQWHRSLTSYRERIHIPVRVCNGTEWWVYCLPQRIGLRPRAAATEGLKVDEARPPLHFTKIFEVLQL